MGLFSRNAKPADVPFTPPGPPPSPEVVALAQGGKLIPAIKLYREQTGLGLAEAKQVVEQYT